MSCVRRARWPQSLLHPVDDSLHAVGESGGGESVPQPTLNSQEQSVEIVLEIRSDAGGRAVGQNAHAQGFARKVLLLLHIRYG